ncbi:EamA family transporter [Microbacterium atlanticum]|uniref:EamA family transporter n=1 Tax=Microbacterium atlanticum TaxID=2782168 RepID=UPI0018873A50|nr:EamA family transporter [Microbacterium atlanticum]
MIAAAVALVGALTYGAADFLGGLAARRIRPVVVTAVAASTGLVALSLIHPLIGGEATSVDVAWGVAAGVLSAIGIGLLYACLAIGPMSILSPLTAVVSAVAPMLWGLLVKGDALAPAGYAGLAVALVAVVLVGFVPGERIVRPSTRGLAMAIGSGLGIGGFLIAVDQTSTGSGLVPLLAGRATTAVIAGAAIGLLAVAAAHRGATTRLLIAPAGASAPSRPRAWLLALACGVADAAANALILLALRTGELAVVSALTALYPAGTILLASVVLRERVAAIQWAGLTLALVAGGLLAVA